MRLFVSAAEISADRVAARVVRALRAELEAVGENLEIIGIGGDALSSEGMLKIVDLRELNVMGSSEVLAKLPKIYRTYRKIIQHIDKEELGRIDAALLIDYPEFHLKLARQLKRRKIPTFDLIPPKIWVWRRRRIQRLRKLFHQVLYVFPFEGDLYESFGDKAAYVGHPLMEELPFAASKNEVRQKLGLSGWIYAVLPGSRPSEIAAHLPIVKGTIEIIRARSRTKPTFLIPVTNEKDESWLKSEFKAIDGVKVLLDPERSALVAADVGLIKSGTSTLEALILGLPHLVFYKPSPLTAWMFKNLVRFPGPVGMSNILSFEWSRDLKHSDRSTSLFPEILMEEVTAKRLADVALQITKSVELQNKMKEASVRARSRLQVGEITPSAAVAKQILKLSKHTLQKRIPLSRELSLLWSSVNLVYRKSIDRGILSRRKLPTKVISVGNIQAGGSGKTPIVAWIANYAHQNGKKVAILTRGYKRRSGDILSLTPEKTAASTSLYGDEPMLLHELAPHAAIAVGKNRTKAYEELKKEWGALDLVILDDGLQNARLERDLDITCLTSRTQSEIPYRDFPTSIPDHSLRVWTKGDTAPPGWRPGDPKLEMKLPSPDPKHRSVVLVCGVSDPASVQHAAEKAGYKVQGHSYFPDHHAYSKAECEKIRSQVDGLGISIAMTFKDFVKWREVDPKKGQAVVVLEPELKWVAGFEHWERAWNALWDSSSSTS